MSTVSNIFGADPTAKTEHGEWPNFFRLAGESFARGDSYFRRVLDGLPAAVYITDAAGLITYYNEAAVSLWGHRPELGKSQWCGSWKLYRPDGARLPHDQCPMALALRNCEAIREPHLIAERPDGAKVPFVPYPTILRDDHSRPCDRSAPARRRDHTGLVIQTA